MKHPAPWYYYCCGDETEIRDANDDVVFVVPWDGLEQGQGGQIYALSHLLDLQGQPTMPCLTYERTNDRVERVKIEISELIAWAEADAQHARENDAPGTARDDMRRARLLKNALDILENCKR